MEKEVIQRKRVCKCCGRKLWLRDFYLVYSNLHYRAYTCKDCVKAKKRANYTKNDKVKDGIFYNEKLGRLMEHKGYSHRIFWNKDMLDMLREYYPNTKNEEVAGMCGVSVRTAIRKANELGLKKNKDYLLKSNRKAGKIGGLVKKLRINKNNNEEWEH